MEEIIIEVDDKANVTISVNGVKGKRCKEVTAELEKALGAVVSTKETHEMHEKPVQVQNVIKR